MPTPEIISVTPIIGLEVHVELSTRRKMFSAAPSPADPARHEDPPNSLIDPVVLGLPGALPTMNGAAVELAMRVGLALRCTIASVTKWDRKSYFYPDMPKAYQISQYDLPLCFDGAVDLPQADAAGFPDLSAPSRRIGILRAHLEEDAGKLLHEAPGGGKIDFSILDLNRAGTPLLEIVTQPDFSASDQVVLFAKSLRTLLRFLDVTQGIMQKGHIRFEPNINCRLALADGRIAVTPIVEVKNLNSFKSLKGAIDFELADQPRRWLEDQREHGPNTKTTRGWDDARSATFVQREKEDAHDYRYFPDPDLPPVRVDQAWKDRIASTLPEPPLDRFRRYVNEAGLAPKEAFALTEEPDTCRFYEAVVDAIAARGPDRPRAGKLGANWVLGACAKRANEHGVQPHEVGILSANLAAIAVMRETGDLNNQGAESIFAELCGVAQPVDVTALAQSRGLLVVRDDAAVESWIAEAIAANPKAAEDVRAGKIAAIGRLVGDVMKRSGGVADAASVRTRMLKALGQ